MPSPRALGQLTSPEVSGGATLVVPVGAVEQHGPHLPLDTDVRIAGHLVEWLVRARPALRAAPPLPYGSSGEHEGFTGTISIGTETLTRVLVELGRSATGWAGRVLLVNGHGGNLDALQAAVSLLRHEGRDVAWWSWAVPDGDAHAGHVETSLLLHLDADLVQMAHAVRGDCRDLATILPALRAGGVAAVSPTGVLGDPTTASAAAGARMLDDVMAALIAAVDGWAPDSRGRLVPPGTAGVSGPRHLTATGPRVRGGR